MKHFSESSGAGGKGLTEDEDQEDQEDPNEPGRTPSPCPAIQHDPWLTPLPGSPLDILAAAIWSKLEAIAPRTSTRRPRKDATERRKAIVGNILANLTVLAFSHPPGHRLAISATNDAVTRYDRKDIPTVPLIKAVGVMATMGLVTRSPGVSRRLRTTVEASAALRSAMVLAGVSLADVANAPGCETIILKADMGRRIPKRLISYQDCPEADRLRAEMDTINRALNGADIRLDGMRLPSITMVRIFQLPSPETAQSFNQYGRAYRGPWLDLKRERRRHLTINGEHLCDLDYQAAFLSIAYAWHGVALPHGDPYSIAGLERHRAGAKQAISSMFFREGGIKRISPELRALLPEGWTGERLTDAIMAHHQAIGPLLGTNCGPDLTFAESNILVAVLLRLISLGVVALGCHDGILCAERHKAAAVRAMREVSADLLGVALNVVEKPL
ncbi:hypothetical protein NKJ55_28350 [Mesorhizobium sp. M0106]|uniref:hypothetical protein n=1 Tax=Mesorhizobium sp. M0106 TaxID=2956880 RepID=UPI0033386F4B